MGVSMGPWVVTVWIGEWPSANKRKLEFNGITKDLLAAKLNKLLKKKNPIKLHGVHVPPNVVRFEIRAKK